MRARAYMWRCPCCGDPGPWLSRWYEDHAYDGDRCTRVSCHHCGESEWSNRTPEHFTALWGHEWKVVAWMALASDEHEGGGDTITSLLCSGRREDRMAGA